MKKTIILVFVSLMLITYDTPQASAGFFDWFQEIFSNFKRAKPVSSQARSSVRTNRNEPIRSLREPTTNLVSNNNVANNTNSPQNNPTINSNSGESNPDNTNISKSCSNFPPPNFCSGGVKDITVIGVDQSGCSIYDCQGETDSNSGESKFGFLSTMGQGVNVMSNAWKDSFNLDLGEESQKLAQELGIGWSREVSFMYTGRENHLLSPYHSNNLELAKNLDLKMVSTILVEEDQFKKDTEGYKTWLTNVINEYKDNVKYWQIQNEVGKKGRYEDADGYLDLVKVTAPIIKNTCSDCSVMMGSLIPEEEYYKAVVKGGDVYVNAYDFHVFDEEELDKFVKFADFLRESGISKSIFVTEMATHSGVPVGRKEYQSESDQAKSLIRWYTEAFSIGADYVFWNELIEWYKFGGNIDALFDFTGLVYNGLCDSLSTNDVCNDEAIDKGPLVKKESYFSLRTLIDKIDYFSSLEKIKVGQYRFNVGGNNVYIFWCDSGDCSLPSEVSGTFKVTDYLGNESLVNATEISLTSSPIFVEEPDGIVSSQNIQPRVPNVQSTNNRPVRPSTLQPTNDRPPRTQSTNSRPLRSSIRPTNNTNIKAKCGDGICDRLEKINPNLCPGDC